MATEWAIPKPLLRIDGAAFRQPGIVETRRDALETAQECNAGK
jgi:hypothetical protein